MRPPRPGQLDPRTDAELVALHRAGDPSAASLIVDRHYGLCLSAVKRIALPPHVEADDLLQDALLALYRAFDLPPSAGGWDPDRLPKTKLATYAYRSVWWAVLRGVKEDDRRVSGKPDQLDDMDAIPHPGPQADVTEALDRLPPLARRLALLVGGGVSVREAGERLGLTQGRSRELIQTVRDLLAARPPQTDS